VLQECYKSVTRALQECCKSVARVCVCTGGHLSDDLPHRALRECYKSVMRALQECCKSVARMLKCVLSCCEDVITSFKNLLRVSSNTISDSLLCFSSLFLARRKDLRCVPSTSWDRYKGVTRVLQGCNKGVTRVLQGCYKDVTSSLSLFSLLSLPCLPHSRWRSCCCRGGGTGRPLTGCSDSPPEATTASLSPSSDKCSGNISNSPNAPSPLVSLVLCSLLSGLSSLLRLGLRMPAGEGDTTYGE
jgi:hypothetical protein